MAHYPTIGCITGAQQSGLVTETPVSVFIMPLNEGAKLDIKQVMHPRKVANGTGGQQVSVLGMANAELNGEIAITPNAVSAVVDGDPSSGDIGATLTLTTIANGDHSNMVIAMIDDVAQASETITWSPTGLTIHKHEDSTNTQIINAVATPECGDAWGNLTTGTPTDKATAAVDLFSTFANFVGGSADSVGPGEPDSGKWLEASGFYLTGTPPDYIYTLSPDSDNWEYMAVQSYSGNMAGESIYKTGINMMCESTIEGKVGEVVRLKIKGLGAAAATPVDGSFFAGSTTITETVVALLKKINMTVAGGDYKIYDFSINPGYKAVLIPDGSEYGYERGTLVPGPATFKLKVLCEGLAVANPFDDLVGKTVDDFDISFGATGQAIKIMSGASQIDEVAEVDEAGVGLLELTGHFINNDLQIKFNVTLGE